MPGPLRTLVVLAALAASPAATAEVVVDVPYAAGTPDDLVLRGRVFRTGASRFVPSSDARPAPARNIGAFLTNDVEGAAVTVRLGIRAVHTRTDDEGFFEARFSGPPALPVGAGEAVVTVKSKRTASVARVPVDVVPRGPGLTVISDFDDTLVHTGALSTSETLENAILRGPEELKPVPAMAPLFRCLVAGTARRDAAHTVVHYLSASPVNLHRKIRRYLALHRFPPGPIQLRHLQVRHLHAPPSYKVERILEIAARFPQHRLLLVGDAGEKDPEVYAAVRERLGERVAAILIHRVDGARETEGRFDGMILFDDGRDAARALARLDLVHPICADRLAPKPPPAPAPDAAP